MMMAPAPCFASRFDARRTLQTLAAAALVAALAVRDRAVRPTQQRELQIAAQAFQGTVFGTGAARGAARRFGVVAVERRRRCADRDTARRRDRADGGGEGGDSTP